MEAPQCRKELDFVTRAQSGDIEAFAEIVRLFQSPIVRYLYRLTGDEELARDLAQDTFIRAYKALGATRPDLSLKAWLYRIATNAALQHLRRNALVPFVPLDEDRRPGVPGVSEHTVSDIAERAAVHEALLRLPERLRVPMILHLVDGFKYQEISEMLGISKDAVRMRVARGCDEFRLLYGVSAGGKPS